MGWFSADVQLACCDAWTLLPNTTAPTICLSMRKSRLNRLDQTPSLGVFHTRQVDVGGDAGCQRAQLVCEGVQR